MIEHEDIDPGPPISSTTANRIRTAAARPAPARGAGGVRPVGQPAGSGSEGQPLSTLRMASRSAEVTHTPYFFFTATCRAT